MDKKVKIRGWLIIVVGVALAYLIQPILIQSNFALSDPTSRANLAYTSAVLGIGGNILIFLGLIITIFKWIRDGFSKKAKNLLKE